ncbi:MAG: hypothetical protein ACXVRZ_04500 [Gaiellaceae bacterium]
MKTDERFGELERLPARDGWTGGEAGDFTPWLADHLDVLGGELGLALELKRASTRSAVTSSTCYSKMREGAW